jgi:hypothetical protein
MPNRVIYLKNPTSGSHFRTIGGGSGSSSKKPRKSKSKPNGTSKPSYPGQYVPPGTFVNSNGAIYAAANPNWAINNSGYSSHPSGTTPSSNNGVGGPTDFSWMLPTNTEQYGNRDMTPAELIIGMTVLAPLYIWAVPEVMAGTATAETVSEAAAAGIGASQATAWSLNSATGGWAATAGELGIRAASGMPITLNDSPKTHWDRATGGYVTTYPDLVQMIEAAMREGDTTYSAESTAKLDPWRITP